MARQSNHFLSQNNTVAGLYYGKPFKGVIYDRQIIDQNTTLYYINLEQPIETLCGLQDSICFDARVRDELSEISETHYIGLS